MCVRAKTIPRVNRLLKFLVAKFSDSRLRLICYILDLRSLTSPVSEFIRYRPRLIINKLRDFKFDGTLLFYTAQLLLCLRYVADQRTELWRQFNIGRLSLCESTKTKTSELTGMKVVFNTEFQHRENRLPVSCQRQNNILYMTWNEEWQSQHLMLLMVA